MRRTVVIVDDNERFRRCTHALLDGEGYAVLGEAGDGETGLDAVRALRPDVVLLDVQLPGLDGFEVARRLRADRSAAAVVLISARDPADYGAAVTSCGARGFVAKAELCGETIEAVLA